MAKREYGGRGRQKGCERLTSMRTIIGERKPNDRYDVRSRDFHATAAHMSYGKLSNGTTGGASNLLAHEDLEIICGGSSLEYTSQVLYYCDAPKIKPCTVIIHARYTIEIKDSR